MTGYNLQEGMSNNAINAYEKGLVPASKILSIPTKLIKKYCKYAESHHTSKHFNMTNFYNEKYVRAIFGLDASDVYDSVPDAVQELKKYKENSKEAAKIYEKCQVEWLDWSGSRRHRQCKDMSATNCKVSIKKETATITLPDGSSFQKRLSTNGFKIRSK